MHGSPIALSKYQLLFLQHMRSYEVQFLIVGGHARRLCRGEPGFDLDLWINYSEATRSILLAALSDWVKRHPSHTPPSTLEDLPKHLRSGIQIKFPEYDGVWFLDGSVEYQIDANSGVDLLIEGETKPEFNTCADQAEQVEVAPGLDVKCISAHHDLLLPRLNVEPGA